MSNRFQVSSAAELRPDLSSDKRDKNFKLRRAALKRVVANMTMNNTDMINLFPEVIQCLALDDMEIKKMCLLYLETYAKTRPQQAMQALKILKSDLSSDSPVLRARVLRTMSGIFLKPYVEETVKACRFALTDRDAYVRKTAVFAIAKSFAARPSSSVIDELLKELNKLLGDENATVVASAVAALSDLNAHSKRLEFTIEDQTARNLTRLLPSCNEWSQSYILDALLHYTPETSEDALDLIDDLLPRLKHANSSVIMGAIRAILYFGNYVPDLDRQMPGISRSLSESLNSLLSKPVEIQYVVLRNCIPMIQHHPEILKLELKHFMIRSSDPGYIKVAKGEIMLLLVTKESFPEVLRELESCIPEQDELISRKAIRAIQRLAVKMPTASDKCVSVLLHHISQQSRHVVQESTVAMQHIVRHYPGRYSQDVKELLSYRDVILADTESSRALVWLCGELPHVIREGASILRDQVQNFGKLAVPLQLTLMTAAAKLLATDKQQAQIVVPHIFQVATEISEDPDVRDRAFMYWRLMSAEPAQLKSVVANIPQTSGEDALLDESLLEELELSLGYLSTVYLKPANKVFRLAEPRKLKPSPALAPRKKSMDLLHNKAPIAYEKRVLQRQHSMAFVRPPTRFIAQDVAPSPITETFDEDEKLIDI